MRFPGSSLLALTVLAGPVFGFEAASDEELGGAVGQAGVSLGITQPTVGFLTNEVYLNDSGGVPASITSGYDRAGNLVAWGWGVKACPDAACSAMSTAVLGAGADLEAFKVDVDATGDIDGVTSGNQPTVRVSVAWGPNVSKLRVFLSKLSLRNGLDSNGTRYGANNSDFLTLSPGYFDLTPASGVPAMTILLGNEAQSGGNMITLANANFTSVDFGTVSLLDASTGQNMNFSFRLDNLYLSGATVNFSGSGLIMTMPQLSSLGVMMRNMTVGGGGSMGTAGVQGLNVSGLTMTVVGKPS